MKSDPLTCRAALPSDESLRYEIFVTDRAREFDMLWLSADQQAMLIDMQFRARQVSYEREFPNATKTVVCLRDRTPVGYYSLVHNDSGYRLVDLAVLPRFRKCGIGGWAVRQLQQRCAAEDSALSLRVQHDNPALNLYRRLGFRWVGSDAISSEMIWAHWLPVTPAVQMSAPDVVAMDQGLLCTELEKVKKDNLSEALFAH